MLLRNWFLYFRSMKHYLIVSTLVFGLGVVLGYGFSDSFQTLLNAQMKQLQSIANEIDLSGRSQWYMFMLIFMNNLKVIVTVILLGVFFGLIPLFFLLSNGLMLGYVAMGHLNGFDLLDLLKGLLPHGIIEIPAFIAACAYGIRCGFLMFEGLWSWSNQERRITYLIKLRLYLKQLIPTAVILGMMMLIAAMIESTVTYTLMK